MKKYLLIILILLASIHARSQLFYNNGALVSVRPGGVMQINGSIQNSNAGTLQNNGDLTVTADITNNAAAAGDGIYRLAGNWTNNGTFNPGLSTVIFNGNTLQTIGGTVLSTFNNLTINNPSSGVTLSNIDAEVNNTLTLTSGRLNVASANLTLNSTATAVAGSPFTAANMVVVNQGGELRKKFTSTGMYFFPVGDNAGIAEYSPVAVNITSASGFSNAYTGIKVNDIKHPDNNSTTHYLKRYWSITQVGIASCLASINANYVTADISGTEASIKSAQLNGTFNQLANPWVKYVTLTSNTLAASGATLSPGISSVFTGVSGDDPTVSITGGDITVCQGANVTLQAVTSNADPTVHYMWSAGMGNNAIATPSTVLTGTSTYTVTITDGNGITASTSTTLTVAPSVGIPAFALGTASSRCQGAETIVYNATAGNSGSITYSLDAISLNAGNTINSTTGEVTYDAAWTGTTVITATATGCNGPTTAQHTVTVGTGSPVTVSISANPSGSICSGTSVTYTAIPVNGGLSPVYQWRLNGQPLGNNSSTFVIDTLEMGDQVSCQVISNASCVSGNPANSNVITMVVKPSLTASVIVTPSANPACTHTLVNFTATAVHGGTTPAYAWYLNGALVGGNSSTYSNAQLLTGDSISCLLTSNQACVLNSPTMSDAIIMTVSPMPIAQAGNDTVYSSTPIQIGSALNGPGIISWQPVSGLDNPAAAQPFATPAITTVYTVSVDNNGCVVTDGVTVSVAGGKSISGKTRYLGKANVGNPVPNMPHYNADIYTIDRVIVRLRQQGTGIEIARDTSDGNGLYAFNGVSDGNYILSYDKYTADTMQWGDAINAIDVALLKYLLGTDTLLNPSRNFLAKYKKAANVDNVSGINAVDIARIKSKIGSPNNPAVNFPVGNWVALDTAVTMNGSDLTVPLKTICYGDYDASSSKYRDSLSNWSSLKSLTHGIIGYSGEELTVSGGEYFEVPLKISHNMEDFSALGLELDYPSAEYKLITAYMKGQQNTGVLRINPTLAEIIAKDDDLLVTDANGVIRVVFATTNHYDLSANDDVIVLGFRPLVSNKGKGTEFVLSGTGVIGNQYGEENKEAYLMMPQLFVQGGEETGITLAGYPNPFNDEVNIDYTISEDGIVKISVYNALGEVVAYPVHDFQAAGKHSLDFAGKHLASGLYTFKLEFVGKENSTHAVMKLIK